MAKKDTSTNATAVEAKRQMEIVAQKFIENPTPFFAEKEKEIAEIIEKYGDLQAQDLAEGITSKKDYTIKLSESLMKPFVNAVGNSKKHTADSLIAVSDFYWEKMVLPLADKVNFIPNIHDLFSLLNISSLTFSRYSANGDEAMREACQIIRDKFISYYQRRGLTKEIDNIMAMFVLKTTFQQRENDTPQVVIANVNNNSAQEKIDDFARKHGFTKWQED